MNNIRKVTIIRLAIVLIPAVIIVLVITGSWRLLWIVPIFFVFGCLPLLVGLALGLLLSRQAQVVGFVLTACLIIFWVLFSPPLSVNYGDMNINRMNFWTDTQKALVVVFSMVVWGCFGAIGSDLGQWLRRKIISRSRN